MNTREAKDLISKGWILKHSKDPFFHDQAWLRHPTYDGPGCAKYMSIGVYKNLLKLGYKSTEYSTEYSNEDTRSTRH